MGKTDGLSRAVSELSGDSGLVEQLIRENQAILSNLNSAELDLKKLKLELEMALDGQLQLSIRLADADREIKRLTINVGSAPKVAQTGTSNTGNDPGWASKIQLSTERFRQLFECSSEAFFLTDAGRLTLCNRAAASLLGLADRASVYGRSLAALSPPHQPDGVPSEERAKVHAETAQRVGNVHFDWAFRRQDSGEDVPCEVILTALPVDGSNGFLASVRDATERHRQAQRMEDLAFLDPLTGLPNRRLLIDRVAQALAHSKRNACHGAVIFLDLDHFKALNDRFGHAFGDEVLRQAAKRVQRCVRMEDTVSRQGGDEFVVVIVDLDADLRIAHVQGQQVAEKIRLALGVPYEPPQAVPRPQERAALLNCPASLGLVIFDGQQDVASILHAADSAMYRAKTAGGNRIETGAITRT